jgi:glycosidase
MRVDIKKRLEDWRLGAVVYQVIVDRFAESLDIDKKISKGLYDFPRELKSWNVLPKATPFNPHTQYHDHELTFYGGDLKSLRQKLEYIKSLGVDVLYLNPIVEALSNHKYDATDYLTISEEYGSEEDLKALIDHVHHHNMKIMLDGVFNHLGIHSTLYKNAMRSETHPSRKFFDFNPNYPKGVRLWANVDSLPELQLEEEVVQNYIYKTKDSVVQKYVALGVDGWRLDVAFDLGYYYLSEITKYSHQVNPKSMVIGEVHNYPSKWAHRMDGVMNFTFRALAIKLIKGEQTPKVIQEMIQQVIKDTGIEKMLSSWMIIDNHDMPRLTHVFDTVETQRLAFVLLFTLPGSPNLYYGTELGMEGGGDPENRRPMAWHLDREDNPYQTFVKTLINLRQSYPSLKVGDYHPLMSQSIFAFIRKGSHIREDIYVFMNVCKHSVSDILLIDDPDLMNYATFDVLSGEIPHIHVTAGVMEVTMHPVSYVLMRVKTEAIHGYTPYKRIEENKNL